MEAVRAKGDVRVDAGDVLFWFCVVVIGLAILLEWGK